MNRLTLRSRNGVALPTAIIALVVVSLFVAASAFFALQEARASRAAWTERSALEAAEYGATAVLRDWDPALNTAALIGSTLGPFATSLSTGARASALVTRLSPTTFWVVSSGTSGAATHRAEARRVVNAFLRLDRATPVINAALTVRDSAEVLAGGVVSGTDSSLAMPSSIPACAGAGTPTAGVAAPDTTRVCDGSCGGATGNIRGTPALALDPLAGDSMRYLAFGARSRQSLTRSADIVLPPNAAVTPGPNASGSTCQRGSPSNWGDPSPSGPCGTFFPVIWSQGDVTITGGVGQGILLADGDVRLAGGAQFTGLIVSRGDVITLAGGGTVLGAVLAGDLAGSPGHSVIGAGSRIQYSHCAIDRALLGSASLRRVMQRWWSEFF